MSAEHLLESLSGEVKQFTERANGKLTEVDARLLSIEQKLTAPRGSGDYHDEGLTIGQQIVSSDSFKAFQSSEAPRTGRIKVSTKTALVNSTLGSNLLVAADRRPIVDPIVRRLTVADVLPSAMTNSNSVEFPRESAFTNNAGPQYSAGSYENVTKPESALSFTLVSNPVTTLAHWIPVSKQLLDDSPALAGYVDSRLLYGLKLKEEDELLNGSGIQGHLSGLITNATAFSTSAYASTDSLIDTIQHAATQLASADLNADVVILNPTNWSQILSTKEASTNAYIFASPQFAARPLLWGLQVVVTNSIAADDFLVLDSRMAAMVFRRSEASVEVSREHSDYFVRNMAAVLCEERLTLAILHSGAILYGTFPFGS
jgi:HK97 family phage major capsid protein